MILKKSNHHLYYVYMIFLSAHKRNCTIHKTDLFMVPIDYSTINKLIHFLFLKHGLVYPNAH